MITSRSEALFREALEVFPGGVNSPVRAFGQVGGTPRFIARGQDAFVFDEDGNEYVDYVLSWGPLVLGHAHPSVIAAVTRQAALGTTFGAPTVLETKLAELIREAMPSIDILRFVSTGTEAVMSAMRLARGFTQRSLVVKFAGCYHGHADPLLVQAGSGIATFGIADSTGVPAAALSHTIVAPYNDLASLTEICERYGDDIAAILVEPVAGNMGLVLPRPEFLPGLRGLADRHGALLVFDEVMTGFRVARGGAQAAFGVTPDLTVLGKIIGGGLPAAAYGGRRDIMAHVAPMGSVYQAGTLSGNPLAMAAGIATLEALSVTNAYATLAHKSHSLVQALCKAAACANVPLQTASIGGMWGYFFSDTPVNSFADARRNNIVQFSRFFHAMLEAGVYLAPSPYEAGFVSLAHDDRTLDITTRAFTSALKHVAEPLS